MSSGLRDLRVSNRIPFLPVLYQLPLGLVLSRRKYAALRLLLSERSHPASTRAGRLLSKCGAPVQVQRAADC